MIANISGYTVVTELVSNTYQARRKHYRSRAAMLSPFVPTQYYVYIIEIQNQFNQQSNLAALAVYRAPSVAAIGQELPLSK